MITEFEEQSVSSTITMKMESEPVEATNLNSAPMPSLTGSVRIEEDQGLVEIIPKSTITKSTRLKITKPMIYGRKAFLRKIHDFVSFLELDSVTYPIGTTPNRKANLQNTVRKAIEQLERVKRVIYDLNDFVKPPQHLHNQKPRLEIKSTASPIASSSLLILTPLGMPRSGAVILPTKPIGSNYNNVAGANQHFVPTENIQIVSVSSGIPKSEDVVLSNEVPEDVTLSNEIPSQLNSDQPTLNLSDFEVVRFDANTDTVAGQPSVGTAQERNDCIIVFESNNSNVDVDLPLEFTTKG
jgi:hypothetical protein